MAAADSLLYRVVARLGVSTRVKAFIAGEFAWFTDTKTLGIGDDTATPPLIPTTKSTGAFDLSSAERITLPGGAVFEKGKPGQVDGVNLRQFNAEDGVLVRTGNGKFAARAVISSDDSLIVEQARGVEGNINVRINPDSATAQAIAVRVIVSALPPEDPKQGQLWFDNEESVLYVRIVDGTNAYWLSLT